MLRAGARAYSTASSESGWVAAPLPAIYSGDAMKGYREWLPESGFEATCSVGGSFQPDNVEEFYLTPWDLGYGRLVKFDHDFIGREALEKMAGRPHRTKVTLVWDKEDVLSIFAGMMDPPCHSEVHQRKRQRDERSSLRAGQAMARIL